MTVLQPPLTYELAIANARRLLHAAAEQETDLISCRETGES